MIENDINNINRKNDVKWNAKNSFEFIAKFITMIIPISILITEFSQLIISYRASRLYGVPSFYFYNNFKYSMLLKMVYVIFSICIIFTPIIIKKSSSYLKFNITKFESIYYTVLVSLYTIVLYFYIIIELLDISIAKNMNFKIIASGLIVLALILIAFLAKNSKKYLDSYIRSIKIIDSKDKIEPDAGYRFITFNFNEGKILGDIKKSVKYQIPIGSKISDAVKYVDKHNCIRDIKKDGENLSYWSDTIEGKIQYENMIVQEDFDNSKVLYAQYSNKKYKDKKTIFSNYIIITFIISIFIFIGFCISWNYRIDPKNKVDFEIVEINESEPKVIIGNYDNKAILMDYKISDNYEENNRGPIPIEIDKGKFYIESLDGKKIETRKFKIVNAE